MKHFICIAISVLYCTAMWSQEIYATFQNPSFEGVVGETTPPNWITCEQTPDTGPYWGPPYHNSFDGTNYLGLINGAGADWWEESVSQRLEKTLFAGHSYYFNIYMSSDSFPIADDFGKFSFWLNNDSCGENQLIYVSPILNRNWTQYQISFTANMDYTFLKIKADIVEPGLTTGGYADLISPIYEGYPTAVSMPNMTSKDIVVYPNPSEGLFSINMPSSDMARHINVYDNLGRLIKSMDIAAHTKSVDIDLSNYAQGLFFISVVQDGLNLFTSSVIISK